MAGVTSKPPRREIDEPLGFLLLLLLLGSSLSSGGNSLILAGCSFLDLEDVLKVKTSQKLCQSSDHNPNHGNINECLRGLG